MGNALKRVFLDQSHPALVLRRKIKSQKKTDPQRVLPFRLVPARKVVLVVDTSHLPLRVILEEAVQSVEDLAHRNPSQAVLVQLAVLVGVLQSSLAVRGKELN